jgi:NAD(P)-dependent dehydrogenase (short-subunit alcohol dehydrogenase family)
MILAGKRALVTGAARGLGRAIAVALASEGADVVVGYATNADAAEETAAQIRQIGPRATTVGADIQHREACEHLIGEAVGFLGGLDILVNNAGSLHVVPFLDLRPEEWQQDVGVNLGGVFHCSQLTARQMVAQGGGGAIVVVTSSGAAIVGPQQAQYCAAKAGADMLARAMAYELGPHGITVNVVAPGPAGPTDLNRSFFAAPGSMETTNGHIPLGRIATPDDVANAVVFAVSPPANYMTGARIAVDGGYTLGKDQTK